MDSVEVQLARLATAFEAEQRNASQRHSENVQRLVRIEHKQDITNGRVTKLETQQAIDDAEDADDGKRPITRRDWAVAAGTLGVAYAVLKALGWL